MKSKLKIEISNLAGSEKHQALMSHNSVSYEYHFEHKCWDLFKLCRFPSELDVIESKFYFCLRFAPEVGTDKLSVEGTEKVQGPDDPVGSLLRGFLLFLKCNTIYFRDNAFLLRWGRWIYYFL